MNIPFPPTDSLYKYCALVGTLLIVLSLYALVYFFYEYDEKLDSDIREHAKGIVEIKFASSRLNQIQEIEKREQFQDSLSHSKSRREVSSQYSQKELDALRLEILTLDKNLNIKSAELEYQHSKVNSTELYYKEVSVISGLLILVGLILAIYGYSKWYTRIQKYTDLIMFNSALFPIKKSARLTRRSS